MKLKEVGNSAAPLRWLNGLVLRQACDDLCCEILGPIRKRERQWSCDSRKVPRTGLYWLTLQANDETAHIPVVNSCHYEKESF